MGLRNLTLLQILTETSNFQRLQVRCHKDSWYPLHRDGGVKPPKPLREEKPKEVGCAYCVHLPIDQRCVQVIQVEEVGAGEDWDNTIITNASSDDYLPPKVSGCNQFRGKMLMVCNGRLWVTLYALKTDRQKLMRLSRDLGRNLRK